MTVKGGSSPACAACKYQRRKCSSDCLLAPYFPANQPKVFQNVHRLFGVANVRKILDGLETKDQKEDAMKSVVYEAEMRQKFPVHGCYAIIHQLYAQLQYAVEELRSVYSQLSVYRELILTRDQFEDTNCISQYSGEFFGAPVFQFTGHNTLFVTNQFPEYENNKLLRAESSGNVVRTSIFESDSYCHVGSSDTSGSIQTQSQLGDGDVFRTHIEKEIAQHRTHMLAYNMTDDDEKGLYSCIETKPSSELSSESWIKDTAECVEQVSRSELKTAAAAAYFSLTTFN